MPLRGIPESRAKIVFGRPIRDSLPSKPMRKCWVNQNHHRELGMAKIKVENKEKLDERTKNLVPLEVGDHVSVQNQTGPNPTRWDKSGTVVEKHGHRQYSIRLEGSRRVTLRNRKFFRKVDPITIQNNVWSGPTSPRKMRSDGEPVTVEPTPRVVPTSPGWVTPPRRARTPARDEEADPEVTLFPEVGGNDASHELNLSELMISEQPEVTVTTTPGEASSGPRRGTRSRRKPSYLDAYEM